MTLMTNNIRVGPGRMIRMRYTMKNSQGDLLAQDTASFLYGSGEILAGLETPLTGLRTGEQKSFILSPNDTPQLHESLHFAVTIEDVRWPSEVQEQIVEGRGSDCGPGCGC